MTTLQEHRNIIHAMEDDLKEKIRMNVLADRQNIVGFAVSEGAVNMFAYFLHKKQLISPGFNVKHNIFASQKRAESQFPFLFSHKDELLKALVRVEMLCDRLCYGKKKPEAEVEEAVSLFFQIKKIIENELGEQL